MSERDVLQRAEYAGLTDQQALDRLLEVIVLRTDSTRYSYQGITLTLGQTVAGTVLVLLKRAAADASLDEGLREILGAELVSFQVGSLDGKTGGLDFSNPDRQAKLEEWIGDLTASDQAAAAAALTAVKELAVTHGPRWQSYGPMIAAEPTLESIAAARATIADESVRQFIADRAQSAVNAVDSGEVLTKEQAREWLGAPL